MKLLYVLILICFMSSIEILQAQTYQGVNKILVVNRDRGTNTMHMYTSKEVTFRLEMDKNEISFLLPMNSLLSTDSSRGRLESLLPEVHYPNVSFKGVLPFDKLDKSIGDWQIFAIQGTFYLGTHSFTTTIPVEFKFSDRQLVFDTYFTLDLNSFPILLNKVALEKYSTVLEFRLDDGRALFKP